MQPILGAVRRAITDYQLIENGDKIAIGVSGGKDSVVLLQALALLRRFIGIEYELYAITLDPGFNGLQGDYSPIARLCQSLDVPYILKRTEIGHIVFDLREEEHPCSLCAKMRRGALHDAAKEAGCNKVALGHHNDDALETFFMNLFIEGRIGCFAPKSYLSRKDLTLIRPLLYLSEKEIANCAGRNNLPIVKSVCPADGVTSREKMKTFIREMEHKDHGFKKRVFGAMRRAGIDGW